MRHCILIRFDLSPEDGEPLPDSRFGDSWLRNRLQLFRRYCLPSLTGQSCQDFEIIVLLRDGTPTWVTKELESITSDQLILGGNYKQIQDNLPDLLRDARPPLVTTRVDSDDVIASDFVETIQNSIGSDSEFLSCPQGCVLRDGLVGYWFHPSNQFVTFVEQTGLNRTVFQRCHSKIGKEFPIRMISDDLMWCWVAHSGNWTYHQPYAPWMEVLEINPNWVQVDEVRDQVGRFLYGPTC